VLVGTLQRILEGDLKILVHETASRPVIAMPLARPPIESVVTNEDWPVPGLEDTELGVFMEPEVGHGTTTAYSGVQA
jgi:hypothetical protein